MKNRNVIGDPRARTALRTFLFLAAFSSTVFGFSTFSGVDPSGFSDLVSNPKDFPSWDKTVIRYKFDASFDAAFPNPRIKDQVRLAFKLWDDAQGTLPGANYSYNRASGWQNFGDIRSVTLHELGHVLGVDHPDEAAVFNRNYRPGPTGLVAQPDNGDEVMRSWINPGDYNHILSHDELDGFAYVYGHDISFREVTGTADITLSTYTNVATNWAQGGGSAYWRSDNHAKGMQMYEGTIQFNDSSSSPLGFRTLGINWDYKNVGGQPTRNIRIRTSGTNNAVAAYHYDNPGSHTFTSFTASVLDADDKDDLVVQWSNPSNGDIPQTDILHVGLELDVWDWSVVWARIGHPDGSESAASLLSFHEWSNTVVIGTPAYTASMSNATRGEESRPVADRTPEDGRTYRSAVDMGPLQQVLARGIRIVGPDVKSEVSDLALANVTGWGLTLADLNRQTLAQLQEAKLLEPVAEFKARTLQAG
jgi:hypothetical protein